MPDIKQPSDIAANLMEYTFGYNHFHEISCYKNKEYTEKLV